MSTTDKPSRSYRIQTSGGEVVVIVPAEPTDSDIATVENLFDVIRRQMREDRSRRAS